MHTSTKNNLGSCFRGNERSLTLAEANKLLAPFSGEKTVVIAVSGGPDSTALLWLAACWRKQRRSGPDILALTVDHGLRAESRSEANEVKRFAKDLGIAHRTVRWTGTKPKTRIQEAARNVRYALIAAEAKKAGARHVLTAHTLDDQAETVLFRLLRGSGPAGLQAMAEVASYPGEPQLVLARPLLSVPKARLIATLHKAGIAFADDASNRDPRHMRPRLRQIMPALAAEGLTAERFATLARRLKRAEAALRRAVAEASDRISLTPWGEGARIVFDRARFFALPDEVALRLLGQAIAHAGNEGPVELAKLEALFEALTQTQDGSAFRRTLAGAMVTAQPAALVIARAPPRRVRTAKPAGRRIPALTTRKTGALGSARTG